MNRSGQIQSAHVVVVITGASGSVYGLRLIDQLLQAGRRVSVLVSAAGRKVMKFETGIDPGVSAPEMTQFLRKHFASTDITCYENSDFFAPIASGTSAPDATVIVPCSMGTLARIASGASESLIERVADVALKERRELVLVPRETPLNRIHLENMLRLSQAGAHILPAMPAFYQHPQSIGDLVDFVVGKILDSLGIEHDLYRPWGADFTEDER